MSTTANPLIIFGRNRYGDGALTTVTVYDKAREAVLVIEGGYIEQRGRGDFVLAAKHPTATDREGDSAYVAILEGIGLTWDGMLGNRHTFTAALLRAQWTTEEPDEDGVMSFVPPNRPWKADTYTIEIKHKGGS